NYSDETTVEVEGFDSSANQYIKANLSGGTLQTIKVIEGGFGYDDKTSISFTGKGKNATYIVSITGGKVKGFRIDNSGQGYDNSLNVAIEGGNPTTPAEAEATVVQFPHTGGHIL